MIEAQREHSVKIESTSAVFYLTSLSETI